MERERRLQPVHVERGLVQLRQAEREKGVVVQEAVDPGLAVSVAVQERALHAKRGEQKVGGGRSGIGVGVVLQDAAGAGERSDRQPVPVGQDLVVQERPRALVPDPIELATDRGEARVEVGARDSERVGDGCERVGERELGRREVEHVRAGALACGLVEVVAVGRGAPDGAGERGIV